MTAFKKYQHSSMESGITDNPPATQAFYFFKNVHLTKNMTAAEFLFDDKLGRYKKSLFEYGKMNPGEKTTNTAKVLSSGRTDRGNIIDFGYREKYEGGYRNVKFD